MAFNTQNITDNTATKITGAETSSLSRLKMCNTKSSGDVTIELYIENIDDSTQYHILKNCVIPGGATLVIENEDLLYIKHKYSLYIKSDSSGGDISIITN
tara:strand:+ start:2119 stop:2418 length:300 start_codon:yes stop_codon:yes gene_type:complete